MPLPVNINLVGVKDQQNVSYSTVKGRWFSPTNHQFLLAADVITSVTVPSLLTSNPVFTSGYIAAEFTYRFNDLATAQGAEPDVWVLPDAAPAVTQPTVAGVVTLTQSELNPRIRPLQMGQTLQFLTSQAGVVVGISYFFAQLQ